jgi:hypothetical protein
MNRARACVLLLALLPACPDFPDPVAYRCTVETAKDDCPAGWTCDGERCADPAGSCAGACKQFYGCGFDATCQADESCTVAFLHEPDEGSCTAACSRDAEGFTAEQLSCIATLACAESYATCDGAG